jgi:hypothetical protein
MRIRTLSLRAVVSAPWSSRRGLALHAWIGLRIGPLMVTLWCSSRRLWCSGECSRRDEREQPTHSRVRVVGSASRCQVGRDGGEHAAAAERAARGPGPGG